MMLYALILRGTQRRLCVASCEQMRSRFLRGADLADRQTLNYQSENRSCVSWFSVQSVN